MREHHVVWMTRAARSAGMTDKLRSTSGETIAEVLVGILIVGLATVLFAGMIGAATNISEDGVTQTEATYAQLSEVDSNAGVSGTATVHIKATEGANGTASLAVTTSTAEADDDSAYTFTSYRLTSDGGE